MQYRVENTDLIWDYGDIKLDTVFSNMKLMLAAAFLMITIGSVLMQHGANVPQQADASTFVLPIQLPRVTI